MQSAPLSRRASLGTAVLVAVAAVASALPSLGAPLLVDERVLAFEAVKWIALDPLAPWTEPLGGSGTWRPLLVYLHRVDAEASAAARHGVSVLLYVALCLGILSWLRPRIGGVAAAWGALWFAAHGAHVAVASWVGGRADLAMGLAAVAALIAWDRGRMGAAAAMVGVAVLFKETAVVLPGILWLLAEPERRRAAVAPGVVAAATFGVSLAVQNVDPGYLPTPAAWWSAAPLWPLFALEAAVPLFRPLGVGSPGDAIGAVAALGIVAVAVRRGVARGPWLPAAAVALLPVLHVLPNDGGQWYLLLPTIPLAGAAGSLLSGIPRWSAGLAVACLLAFSVHQSTLWAEAATRVDAVIEAGRAGGDPPPRQDPRDWPHLGPSLCCGFPYQLFADPRAEGVSPSPPR